MCARGEQLDAEALHITGVPGLDPITAVMIDRGPGQGMLLVECAGESWVAHLPLMGERRVALFLRLIDGDELASRLNHPGRRRTYVADSQRRQIAHAIKHAIAARAEI